jgi:hypothetical protein
MTVPIRVILGKYSLRPFRLGKRESDSGRNFFRKKNKNAAPVVVTDTEKLSSIVNGASYNLFIARTAFPFMLVADTIKIDRQKLTIVHSQLFQASQTASTQIKDIMNIQAETGPFFGNITITSKYFLNNTQTIKFLTRKDVSIIQKLIQGFMIAHSANIETDNINENRLLPMLLELGEANRSK